MRHIRRLEPFARADNAFDDISELPSMLSFSGSICNASWSRNLDLSRAKNNAFLIYVSNPMSENSFIH